MKIELKKFKEIAGHDDTLPFQAEVHVDGKLAAYAHNDGWGGPVDFRPVNHELFRQAEAHCKAMPAPEGYPQLKMHLELYVAELANNLANEKQTAKFFASQKRMFKNHIVMGIRGHVGTYSTQKVKNGIDFWKADPKRTAIMKDFINKTRSELKPGEEILNDNLDGL